ncbi:MAG TPA: arylesterase [Pyrinomonadaceae bacterium]|nr:arylesterase [Pyrinomonadaceae bacterium]
MQHLIRKSRLLSFIFLAVAVASCTTARPEGRSNNAGERPLITPQAVSQRPKIIAFGNSLTAGFGLSEKESYPYLLQERLNVEGFDYEVINAGVSGDTSLGGLERADWVLDQENAKILILELGANDLLRGMPPKQMKSNLDKIIRKAKARNIDVLLCGMLAPPTAGSDYGREFTMAFPDLADEHNIAFLPFLLEGVAAIKDLNQADGIHPNAAGTKIMADNIYKELMPLLKR